MCPAHHDSKISPPIAVPACAGHSYGDLSHSPTLRRPSNRRPREACKIPSVSGDDDLFFGLLCEGVDDASPAVAKDETWGGGGQGKCEAVDSSVQRLLSMCKPADAQECELKDTVEGFVNQQHSFVDTISKAAACEHLVNHLVMCGYSARTTSSTVDDSDYLRTRPHQFVSVSLSRGSRTRLVIVDVFWRSQFEVARPSPRYRQLLSRIPSIYVGGVSRLPEVVRLLGKEVELSFVSEKMPLPPWRATHALLSCWFRDPQAALAALHRPRCEGRARGSRDVKPRSAAV